MKQLTANDIDVVINRASKLSLGRILKKKLGILKDIRSKMDNPDKPLSGPQQSYLKILMSSFSDDILSKAENWESEWRTNAELRERADVVSKYYIAQKGWFMEIARDVQRIFDNSDIELDPPDWSMAHRMLYNDYAEKVWDSHKAPHKWEPGQLVCCRVNARTDGWHYYNRVEGLNVHKDPCMVIESGSKPISNATKYDEKRGGCRWVAINPIGSNHIFHVMEKDLKIYRQPKKKPTKRAKK